MWSRTSDLWSHITICVNIINTAVNPIISVKLYNVQSLHTLYVYSNVQYYSIIQEQWTPLHCAARWGHTDCVALLAASGANVNMKDKVS